MAGEVQADRSCQLANDPAYSAVPYNQKAGVLGGVPEHLTREASLEDYFNLKFARYLVRQIHALLQGGLSGMAQSAAGHALDWSQGFGEYRPDPGVNNPELQVLIGGVFSCPPDGKLGLFGPVESHRKDAALIPLCGSRHCGLPGWLRHEGGTK
jgi:hypothetical protein